MGMNIFTMSMVERRAAAQIAYKYRLNRFELWMLCGLVAVLSLEGRKAISQRECFDRITASLKARFHMSGYWAGLRKKGCLVEYKRAQYPLATSYGVSRLGWQICQLYEAEMLKEEAKYPKGKRLAPHEVISTEEAPKGYTFAKEPIQRAKEQIRHIDQEDKAKRERSNK